MSNRDMGGPSLSKRIPARTKTVHFRWIRKDFTTMCQRYRDIRAECRSAMDSCFWCGHKFEDGENFALAAPEKGTNKVLCHGCADDAMLAERAKRQGEQR